MRLTTSCPLLQVLDAPSAGRVAWVVRVRIKPCHAVPASSVVATQTTRSGLLTCTSCCSFPLLFHPAPHLLSAQEAFDPTRCPGPEQKTCSNPGGPCYSVQGLDCCKGAAALLAGRAAGFGRPGLTL